MKNNLVKTLILVIIMVFASCSSDDDGGGLSQESLDLVGIWEVDFLEVSGENVFNVPCIEQKEYEFRNDLSYSERTFSGDDPDNCSVATTANGSWEDIQEGILLLNPAGSNPSQSFTIEFINANRFRLSQFGSSTNIIFDRSN